MNEHPHTYTDEEQAFLNSLGRKPIPISSDEFDRLHELLGRVPSYELLQGFPGGTKFDYDRPIVLNNRFQMDYLAKLGIEHVMFHGRPFVRTEPRRFLARLIVRVIKVVS